MGTDRRERQKANRAQKLEQEQKAERRDQLRQYGIIGVLVVAGLLGVLYLLSLGGDDEETDTTDTTVADTTTTTVAAEPEEGLASAVVAPGAGASIEGTPECPAADGSSERTTTFGEAPPTCIDPEASYTAELDTTLGPITLALDAERAPETVNNFVFLARYHYYDGAPFHRIISDFMIQGGDATGEPLGTGNPGYVIAEETPEEGEYQVGSLAMAKAPGPTATGAQFFIVTGPAGVALPPEYSLFGEVTEGMDVVEQIEAIPTTPDDAPTEEIYINSVTITEE